eukprot:scaffold3276_cov168-Amphora_coffeaeformis.AAC.1
MEPALRQGDVVCVRKADGGLLPRLVKSLIFGDQEEPTEEIMMAGSPKEPSFARLYDRPPAVQRGQVIVLKSVDTAFPDEWHVKRVWGIPGTWVQVENGRIVQPNHRNGTTAGSAGERHLYRKLQGVPTHTIYVGGDNEDCSRDSRHYGPVSQNLIVGVAEYVVWPPWRMQKICPSTSPSRSVPLKKWEDQNENDDDTEQA